MREIELKLLLDETQEKRLRTARVLRDRSLGRARTETIESTYFDTQAGDLRGAGIALRLRRQGRRILQTVKKKQCEMHQGLSMPLEFECDLEGPELDLTRIADHDLREDIIGLARKGLSPVAETRFRRTTWLMRAPAGGTVELAIDVGTVGFNGQAQPFIEAELELKEGHAGDLYALAWELFPTGPVRFSTLTKSERAESVGQGAAIGVLPPLRKARRLVLSPDMTVEEAAKVILSEGLDHALPNLARTIEYDDPDGPHQLRVGLRRLRSTLSAFRPVFGRETLAPWADQARLIAAEAGRLRDLDVLENEMIPQILEIAPMETGFSALTQAVARRREKIRGHVRTALQGRVATAFGFGFAAYLATRGWLDPADHDQTRRLAAPIRPFASSAIERRWKAVARYGRKIETLSIEARHEMRKELKKLRYVVDQFRSLFPVEGVEAHIAAIKRLQTAFGALNDSAMAELILTAPDAPGADDPEAQRAVGRMIGHYEAEATRLWPLAIEEWHRLAALGPFWRDKQA